MKKTSSNQSDVFKRKNALRYAVGGELTQPPVFGKSRAAQDAAIDAEAVRGTSLAAEQPAPVTPSITAPPPPGKPPIYDRMVRIPVADALANTFPIGNSLTSQSNKALRGFQDGGMIPGEPGTALFPPDRAHGGPSRMRLGANSGIPGIPPAFEEGGPITDNHPQKQGKDNQVVLAAAGEYILPKKTVDAMGGPDTLDHIVRATNGKEPNNSNGSALRAETGLEVPRSRALVPYTPVVGQAGGPPLGIPEAGSFRPGQQGYSALNQAINTAGGAPGNKTAELAKEGLRKFATPKGVGAKAVAGTAKLAARAAPYAVPAYMGYQAVNTFHTPTEAFEAHNPLTAGMRHPLATATLRNAPFVGPIINGLFPQTLSGDQGVADLGIRGMGAMGALVGESPERGQGKKTEIKTEKPQSWADGDRVDRGVPVQAAPSETSAPQAPATSRLRGVMDGVNMAALMTPRGFTGEFGKMLATRGENTAAMLNNRQQMAERQMDWERQKFGLQRDWDMRKFGIEYNTARHDKTRDAVHANIEKTVGVTDDKGRITNPLDVAKAKAQADAYASNHPTGAGYAGMSADDQTRTNLNAAEIRQTINDNTGVWPTLRNWALNREPLRDPLTTEGMRPTGPVVKGALVDDVPTPMGQIGKSTYEGRGVLPTKPVPQYKLDDLELANRKNANGGRIKNYANGGRVAKSKLRSGGC